MMIKKIQAIGSIHKKYLLSTIFAVSSINKKVSANNKKYD